MNGLSLQRPRSFGSTAPRGQDARDLLFYDAAINHPEFGVTPQSILAAFGAAEAGDPTQQNDLFDGMIEGDCHLRSLFEKREQAVAGKPRVIQAGDDSADGQLGAEVMRTAMSRLPLVEVFEHLLKYNRHGYGGCEIDWGILRLGGRDWIVPTWFTPVPVRRFRINAMVMVAQHAIEGASTMKTRDVSQRLGTRIRTLREERELAQGQFADRVGISAAYTSFIERGAKTPSLEVLIGIAEILDVSLSELFLDADREPPKELARLSAAIAGPPIGIQRRIFRVVEEMLGAVRELKR